MGRKIEIRKPRSAASKAVLNQSFPSGDARTEHADRIADQVLQRRYGQISGPLADDRAGSSSDPDGER